MGTIRFLLALAVVLVHSSPLFGITLVPGYLAVRSFYIISGFLMALVYSKKYAATARPYYLFISNRFLRLYPLYIAVVILIALLSIGYGFVLGDWGKFQFYRDLYQKTPGSLPSLVLVFLSNITLVGQDIITFFGINSSTGSMYFLGLEEEIKLQEFLFIPIAWTVAVEFLFYFAAPFIIKQTIKRTFMFIGFVFILRLILYVIFDVDKAVHIYRFALTEIFWFLLGVLSFKLDEQKLIFFKKHSRVVALAIIVFLFAYNYIPWNFKDNLLYASIVLFTPLLFDAFHKNKLDKFLGDLCYPMYLGHAMMLIVVSANRFPKPYGSGPPIVLLTLIFSVAINYLLLIPFEKVRQKRVKPIALNVAKPQSTKPILIGSIHHNN